MSLAAMTPLAATKHEGNWAKIITPLDPREWEKGLASHPDRDFADYICSGIQQGFRLGYNYRSNRSRRRPSNLRSVREHREVVEQFFREESGAGKLLGPLPRDKFPQVHVSPVGVIPKSTPGKWRIIVDLSFPEGGSVNDGIDKDMCSLSYVRVDDVAAKVVSMGRGALMAKFDLRSAYRNIPVHPDDRWLLGTEWEDQLFVDTVLPFGLRSAPMIFNAVAEALAFIIRSLGVKWLEHYLDDFVMVAPPKSNECQEGLQVALDTCAKVGFPVAEDKTEGPATLINFLGVLLDSMLMQLRLPPDKLEKLKKLVASWRRRKVCTKKELRSLAGHLSNACKVVRPGRRFLRGIFGLLSQFQRRDHHIRLNAGFRADLEWWHNFVTSWNGISMMQREGLLSPGVEIWSDASGSWGCGAHWGVQWLQVAWNDWPAFSSSSIAAKELLPIIVAAAIWGPAWEGSTVLCHCDNQSVVAAIRGVL